MAAAAELLDHHCDAIVTGGGRFELHKGNQCRQVACGWCGGSRTLLYLVSLLLYFILISCRLSRHSGCGKQKWDSSVVGVKLHLKVEAGEQREQGCSWRVVASV